MRHRRTTHLALVAAVALAACDRGRTRAPVYEVTGVRSACPAPGGDAAAGCTVEAEVRTTDPFAGLAVLAVTDGNQDVSWSVVPLSRGRAAFRREGLRPPAKAPSLGVRLVGVVAPPVRERLSVADIATTCEPPPGGAGGAPCRTTGRIDCTSRDPFRAVVEVRSPPGVAGEGPGAGRGWAIVRLDDGKAPFAVEWTRPAGSQAAVEVLAAGIVVRPPDGR